MPDMIAFAAVIVLLPMGYFLLASPAFLLVGLDIPPVTQLLRGMFNVHVMAMIVAGVIATLSFVVAGRPGFTVGIGLIAAFAYRSFRWFVQKMDAPNYVKMVQQTFSVQGLSNCIG